MTDTHVVVTVMGNTAEQHIMAESPSLPSGPVIVITTINIASTDLVCHVHHPSAVSMLILTASPVICWLL